MCPCVGVWKRETEHAATVCVLRGWHESTKRSAWKVSWSWPRAEQYCKGHRDFQLFIRKISPSSHIEVEHFSFFLLLRLPLEAQAAVVKLRSIKCLSVHWVATFIKRWKFVFKGEIEFSRKRVGPFLWGMQEINQGNGVFGVPISHLIYPLSTCSRLQASPIKSDTLALWKATCSLHNWGVSLLS